MLRVAKAFGLKARAYRSSWRRLAKTPLPGIAVLRDGSFLLLANLAPALKIKPVALGVH